MADMTYSDSAASIRNNAWFRTRVDIATSKYANYLLNTPDTDPDHQAKWSQGTRIAQQADMIVIQLMFTLSGDAEVLAAGPAIPDLTLQSVVEKTINKLYAPTTPVGMMPMGTPAPPPNWTSTPPSTKQ